MNKKTEKLEEVNPFLFNFEIKYYWEKYVNSETGESVPYMRESDAKVVVYQKYLMKIARKMKGSTPVMFFYILGHLGSGSQKIELKWDIVIEDCEISKSSYRRGIEQLKFLAVIIKAKRKDTYWVNPALCFRGSRLMAFPNMIVDRDKPKL
jgi:hypothetical protein